MGNEDLGKHFHAIGDLPKAFEAFSRMRQDSASTKQVIDVSRHLIEVAFEQKNWIAVSSNAGKIKSLLSQLDSADPSLQPFTMAADAVASMDGGNYYEAAGGLEHERLSSHHSRQKFFCCEPASASLEDFVL